MKTVLIKNNFSAGELSPTLYTRTDIQQYSNGAKRLKNVIPLVEGGVRKRPGTLSYGEQSGAIRLIPFIVNSSNAFLLILKNGSIAVYNPRTKVVVATLASPYTAAQIPNIQYVQYRFELFITHGEVPVQRLRCDEDFSNWNLSAFVFTHPPIDSDNARYPFRKGTPSGKDLGAFITFTLDAVSAWSNSTTYLLGDVVIYSSRYYQAARDNSAKQPNTSPDDWVVVPNANGAGFTADDVGRYIDVNGGLIKITKFNNANSVSGEVVKKLDAVIKAIERSWVILPQAFNATDGYPRCCTYYKQRLVLANTKKAPNKIWFSAVGANGNYLETTEDGDAFSVVSASGLSNSILFLEAQRGVICLTSGGEFMVDSDGALSPTTVNINEHSAYGAYSETRPERVGNELLFVQRGGERMRALTYRYEVDGLVSPEISALSSHIGEEHLGINEISYQQEPESLVWCVLGDGKVTSITFNRDQEVLSWAQHDFGGAVKSICSLPTQLGSDSAFMLIQRAGEVYLEEITFAAYLDSQSNITLSNTTVSKAQFSHLNNISAYILEDGTVTEIAFTDTGSALEFDSYMQGKSICIGQLFECVTELFPPELNQNPLSSMMHKAKVDRIAFFFNKTLGAEINGQLIETFTFEDNLLGPKPPYTGFHLEEGGHWADLHKVPLIITHNKPLPFHMQAVTMQLSINEK
ncbi:carbohydrate-binding protein [Acinetobacter sp. SWBY1]|uniref:carbohydrate-binding protein n=1 Tax=Acinetobacter sp. SWBY1 TaxID=2079596 RepID=UPI000CF1C7DE|nr:carbohydrate-binding protein [Acinetobacter sp. SWBY1]AVH48991.1 carbohydrate-binding protein [Acinetobacter sp. SWBY1]